MDSTDAGIYNGMAASKPSRSGSGSQVPITQPNSATHPVFSTSSVDFDLPPRPLSALSSGTAGASSSRQSIPWQYQRGLGGYALRPRSSLSRTLVSAADEADDEDEVGQQSYSSRYGTSGFDSYRSGKDRDRDRLANRMASATPTSPQALRGQRTTPPDRSHYGGSFGRERAHSPMQRRQPLSPEPWDAAEGGEDDVELDLDGLDMRMADGDDESVRRRSWSAAGSSSSPPPPPTSDFSTSGQRRSQRTQSFTSDRKSTGFLGASGRPNRPKAGHSVDTVPEVEGDEAVLNVVPPLQRVFRQLKDEAKPVEGEVASEAKLTKRLSALNDVVRSAREGSPFPIVSGDAATRGAQDSLISAAVRRRKSGKSDGAEGDAAHHDDDLLDNVGFESDALSTSSEDSDTYEASGLAGPVESAAQTWKVAADDDSGNAMGEIAMEGLDDEEMVADAQDTGHELPDSSQHITRTPPRPQTPSAPASANVSPQIQRTDGCQHSDIREGPLTPLALGEKLSSSSSEATAIGSQGSALTQAINRPTGRKRTGSAWMDFRNSPSATGTGGGLEKRHHRLHGGNGSHHLHRNRPSDSPSMAMARGLSTSPAAVTSLPSAIIAAGGGGSPRLSSSPGASVALNVLGSNRNSVLTKRKYGFGSSSDSPQSSSTSPGSVTGERYDPYTSSAYKRRAVSPLTTMNLSLGERPRPFAAASGNGQGGESSGAISSGHTKSSAASLGHGLSSPSSSAMSRRSVGPSHGKELSSFRHPLNHGKAAHLPRRISQSGSDRRRSSTPSGLTSSSGAATRHGSGSGSRSNSGSKSKSPSTAAAGGGDGGRGVSNLEASSDAMTSEAEMFEANQHQHDQALAASAIPPFGEGGFGLGPPMVDGTQQQQLRQQ